MEASHRKASGGLDWETPGFQRKGELDNAANGSWGARVHGAGPMQTAPLEFKEGSGSRPAEEVRVGGEGSLLEEG